MIEEKVTLDMDPGTSINLTTKSRYGTRLMLDIAVYGQDKPVSLSEISKRQKISLKYLEHITRKLKRAGLITTHRGPFGGQMLAKSPENISIGNIVRTLERSTVIKDCAEEDQKVCGVCNRAGECLSRWVWVEASRAMFNCLDKITLAGLLSTENKKLHKTRE